MQTSHYIFSPCYQCKFPTPQAWHKPWSNAGVCPGRSRGIIWSFESICYLRADVSYFLCCTRATKEIEDVCTQANRSAHLSLNDLIPTCTNHSGKPGNGTIIFDFLMTFSFSWVELHFRGGKRALKHIEKTVSENTATWAYHGFSCWLRARGILPFWSS